MEDQISQDHGNNQENFNNIGVQIDSDETQARAGGCGCDLNLNLNSNSFSPQPRDYHNETIKVLDVVDNNREARVNGLNAGRVEGLLEKSPLITMDAEDEGVAGRSEQRSMSNGASSLESSTKTKTAQLSGNGYSTEMVKINQLTHDQARMTQVADLQKEVNQYVICPVQPESEVSTPPDSGIEKNSAPPGFEGSTATKASLRGKGKARGRHADPTASIRVTRSQLKKARTPEVGSRSTVARTRPKMKYVEDSHCSRQSIESTESMTQLAEEALKVGELLGVKVISHRANAVKRITESLKTNRGKCSGRA